MKGIDSTGSPLVHVPGWMGGWVGGWMDGWMGVKAVSRIAYSNQKSNQSQKQSKLIFVILKMNATYFLPNKVQNDFFLEN